MRSYYPGITLFKVSGAVLVAVAHVYLLRYNLLAEGHSYQFLLLCLRVVVPCFYVVSGFLVCQGWMHADDPVAYIRRYLVRIGAVYALFCAIFAVRFTAAGLLNGGFGLGNLLLQAKILAAAVILNGPFVQLWFMLPLLFGVLAVFLLDRRGHLRYAMTGAALCFAGCQLLSGSLIPVSSYLSAKTGLTALTESEYAGYAAIFLVRYIGFGFTFILAGVLAAKQERVLRSVKLGRFAAAAVMITMLESALLMLAADWSTDYKLAFSLVPNTLLLFGCLLRFKLRFVQSGHRAFNLFSAVTYLAHIPLISVNLAACGWRPEALTPYQVVLCILLTLVQCAMLTAVFLAFPALRRQFSMGLPIFGLKK